MDDADRAAAIEANARADALAEQARRDTSLGKTVADSATHCAVCDEPIPDGRRRAVPGVQTCVDCQSDLERAVQ